MAKEKEVEVVEEVVVAPKKGEESEARKQFRNLIEVYKVQNPAKYELKKDELQRKLDAIA